MTDVTCVGEVIVDLVGIKRGVSLEHAPTFAKHAGGAPANMAAGLALLGTRVAFAGKVGDDPFGRFLVTELKQLGVDTRGIVMDSSHRTRLAFVSVEASGERDFEFWEQHPADEHLSVSDLPVNQIIASTIVHVGSFTLVNEPSRSVVLSLMETMNDLGCSVSFDPNLRISLWKSEDEARDVLLRASSKATILRLNLPEARFLTGKSRITEAAAELIGLGPSIVVITLADRGCYFRTSAGVSGRVKGFAVKTLDTTACGDAFLAGFLSQIVRMGNDLEGLTARDLRSACRFANATGALASTKRGGISAMPSLTKVQRLMRNGQ